MIGDGPVGVRAPRHGPSEDDLPGHGRSARQAQYEDAVRVRVQVARIAAKRGFERIDFQVLDWNTPAIEFYQSLGAVPMEEWTVQRLTGHSLQRLAEGTTTTASRGGRRLA